eukprot:scaffold255843_cov15-Prasinocladus_malaysianus.AAC.1
MGSLTERTHLTERVRFARIRYVRIVRYGTLTIRRYREEAVRTVRAEVNSTYEHKGRTRRVMSQKSADLMS